MFRGCVAESLCDGVHRFHRRLRLRVHRAAPTECGSGHGAVEQSFELRVEFEHGDRRARHVDRRHEVAHQRLVDANARLFEFVGNGVVQHVKFHERSGAEAVDEHRHLVALFAADVLKQVFNDAFCKFIRRLQLFRLSARLAVNAHAELDLVVADVENGSAFRRGSAAGERKAEGANIVDDLVGYRFDFFEGLALFRRRAGYLVHEHRARDAASADGVEGVLHRDVVVDVDRVHFDAVLVLGEFRRIVEVHAVAGIVLDDEQHALVGGAFLDGVVHLDLRGGGEYVAAYRAVEHAFADEAGVCRFVTGSAARYEGNLVGVDLFLFDYLVFLHELKLRMRLGKPVAHIVDYGFGSVDDFLHNNLLLSSNSKSGNARTAPVSARCRYLRSRRVSHSSSILWLRVRVCPRQVSPPRPYPR